MFDFVRTDLMCQTFAEIFYNPKKVGVTVAFGGCSVVFIKEIPMFAKYNLYARIISWSPKGKWLYIQGVFTLPGKQTSRTTTPTKQKLSASVSNIADPAVDSGMSTPTSAIPTTANGATICAVIYGRYVFKRKTRETVPVSEALRICGYTIDDDIEKKRLEGWEYVQGLEHDWERDRALQSARNI